MATSTRVSLSGRRSTEGSPPSTKKYGDNVLSAGARSDCAARASGTTKNRARSNAGSFMPGDSASGLPPKVAETAAPRPAPRCQDGNRVCSQTRAPAGSEVARGVRGRPRGQRSPVGSEVAAGAGDGRGGRGRLGGQGSPVGSEVARGVRGRPWGQRSPRRALSGSADTARRAGTKQEIGR